MHSSLFENLPVLSLTPDSIGSLGELDSASLSEIWCVFTKVKDSLQDGRRLENLSWRLWFESGRRELKEQQEISLEREDDGAVSVVDAQDAGWSDPEWSETTDNESESEDFGPPHDARIGDGPSPSREPVPLVNGTHDPSNESNGRPVRPPISHVNTGSSGGRRPATTKINGGALQRMITGLTTTPLLTKGCNSTTTLTSPLLAPRVSPLLLPIADSPPDSLTCALKATLIDMPTQTTPSSSHRPSPVHSPPVTLRPSCSIAATLFNPTPPTPPVPPPSILRSPPSLPSKAQQPSNSSALPRPSNGIPPPPPRTATTSVLKPALARRLTSVPGAVSDSDRVHQLSRADSEVNLGRRTQSSVSFEPRSLVKGFDTSVFDSRPREGSIAPPPTPPSPSPTDSNFTGPPPPAVRKAAPRQTGTKKMFFIPSHGSDSEDELSRSLVRASSSRLTKTAAHSRRMSNSPLRAQPTPPPPSPASNPPLFQPPVRSDRTAPEPARAPNDSGDEWGGEEDDDEDEDDEDASSGWGSEYSTESDAPKGNKGKGTVANDSKSTKPSRPQDLFPKRPSLTTHHSELKPRGPGLLSQLFHPGQFVDDEDRSQTSTLSDRAPLQTSMSVGVLEQFRNKSFLRGPPAGTEMESSSEEEDGDENEVALPPLVVGVAAGGGEDAPSGPAPIPRQNSRVDMPIAIAPLQTPRTTRRAMLATELSESLRLNVLWERQTRNRVMGGPIHPRPPLPPATAAHAPSSVLPLNQNLARFPRPHDGLRAPHPSPDTRHSSPVARMTRRHTTGTGLYLQAQEAYFNHSSDEEEEESQPLPSVARVDPYRDSTEYAFHGW